MANATTVEVIKPVVVNNIPKTEICSQCGEGIVVTTAGLCSYCDLIDSGVIEKPTSH